MKQTKTIFVLLVALLMLASPIVLAEDTTEDAIVVEDETADIIEEETEQAPGTTPDSPLWGLDRAMERIELALTFGKSAKAKKGLAHARERLAEVKAMVIAKKLAHAEKAKEKFKESMEEVQENIDEISVDEPEENLETVDGFEQELEDLDEQAEKVKELVRIKIRGELTEEQKAKLDSLTEEIRASGERAKIRFDAKKDKAIIKYKTALKKTDAEVQTKLMELAANRLNRKITKMEEITAKAKEKGRDVLVIEQRIADAKNLVEGLDIAETPKLAAKKIQKMLNFRREKAQEEQPEAETVESEETESEEDTDSIKTTPGNTGITNTDITDENTGQDTQNQNQGNQ